MIGSRVISGLYGLLSIAAYTQGGETAFQGMREHMRPLTKAQQRALQREHQRTGVGPMALLRGRKDKPAGLTAGMVNTWLNGSCTSAQPGHIAYVLARWRQASPIVAISDEIRTELLAHKDRTDIGAIALLRRDEDKPDKLTPALLQTWLSGICRSARQDHLDYVLRRYRALPDRRA